MVCERYNDALNEVAAGGPAPAEFDAHLAGCANCRAGLARLRQALAIADEQLRQLSTLEPSARFVPRVRAAVLESATASAWGGGWLWPSLATAAVLVVALSVIFVSRSGDEPIVAGGSHPAAPAAALVPEPVRAPAVASTAENGSTTPRPRPRKAGPRAPAEPQVLVPAGESRALVEFIALVNRERLTPTALVAAGQPMAPLAAPSPISIQPIEIVPLDPATQTGT